MVFPLPLPGQLPASFRTDRRRRWSIPDAAYHRPRWASPKRAAALSPPFILCNSAVGLLGVLIAGQRLTSNMPIYAIARSPAPFSAHNRTALDVGARHAIHSRRHSAVCRYSAAAALNPVFLSVLLNARRGS